MAFARLRVRHGWYSIGRLDEGTEPFQKTLGIFLHAISNAPAYYSIPCFNY